MVEEYSEEDDPRIKPGGSGKLRLGYQQIVLLKRALKNPGQSSKALNKGLSRQNQNEKKLEKKGLLRTIMNEQGWNQWFITKRGQEQLMKLEGDS